MISIAAYNEKRDGLVPRYIAEDQKLCTAQFLKWSLSRDFNVSLSFTDAIQDMDQAYNRYSFGLYDHNLCAIASRAILTYQRMKELGFDDAELRDKVVNYAFSSCLSVDSDDLKNRNDNPSRIVWNKLLAFGLIDLNNAADRKRITDNEKVLARLIKNLPPKADIKYWSYIQHYLENNPGDYTLSKLPSSGYFDLLSQKQIDDFLLKMHAKYPVDMEPRLYGYREDEIKDKSQVRMSNVLIENIVPALKEKAVVLLPFPRAKASGEGERSKDARLALLRMGVKDPETDAVLLANAQKHWSDPGMLRFNEKLLPSLHAHIESRGINARDWNYNSEDMTKAVDISEQLNISADQKEGVLQAALKSARRSQMKPLLFGLANRRGLAAVPYIEKASVKGEDLTVMKVEAMQIALLNDSNLKKDFAAYNKVVLEKYWPLFKKADELYPNDYSIDYDSVLGGVGLDLAPVLLSVKGMPKSTRERIAEKLLVNEVFYNPTNPKIESFVKQHFLNQSEGNRFYTLSNINITDWRIVSDPAKDVSVRARLIKAFNLTKAYQNKEFANIYLGENDSIREKVLAALKEE